ncbi:fluoride efflux transporter FluC [Brachybacterium alimentarium]|uniref:fluoride efflux transporter FluC n=1 Tax=Brachybacterium alimentarium TaxID=47845 RepID=UPI00216267B7|nr:CrcB family protein [Brachybacterium alimentarium]
MTSSPTTPPTPRRDDPRMRTVEMAALNLEDVDATETFGSGPVQTTLPRWKIALLVAGGGAVGSLLRFLLSVLIPTVTTPTLVELPWATFWVNAVGCLSLGVLTGVLEARPARPWVLPLVGTGLCGGFTTFSTVVLEGSAMIGADFPLQAFTYAMMTMVVCLLAVAFGILGGRRGFVFVARRRDRHDPRGGQATNLQDAEADS